jgi:hypothetical protein
MPIYVVGARNPRVQIPGQPLTVSVSGAVACAALVLSAPDDQPVMRPNQHTAVLPRLVGPVSIGLSPTIGMAAFAHGTVVNLAIGHDSAVDLDPVQVVFDPVDVGGDTMVELALLTPVGTGIEVTAAALPDTALGPLASAARTSVRTMVGRGTRASHGAARLAIDVSASMRPAFADGSVAAVTDIVVGVADALGIGDLTAVMVGDTVTTLRSPLGPSGLAEAVATTPPPWSAGTRWSLLTGTAAAYTLVCSDTTAAAIPPQFPVLAISSNPRLNSGCVRIPPPRPLSQAGAELLADPTALAAITSQLVRLLR